MRLREWRLSRGEFLVTPGWRRSCRFSLVSQSVPILGVVMSLLKKRRPQLETLERRALLAPVVSAFPLLTSQAYPLEITADSGGTLWFTESSSGGGKIGKFNPATQVLTASPADLPGNSDGNRDRVRRKCVVHRVRIQAELVHARALESDRRAERRYRPDHRDSPCRRHCRPDRHCRGSGRKSLLCPNWSDRRDRHLFATDHDVPLSSSDESPTSIAIGDDGNAWYTAPGVIGRFDLTTHQITEFTIPSGDSNPQTIINRPGGDLWFTDSDEIGRIRSIAVTNTSPFDVPSNATYTLPTGQRSDREPPFRRARFCRAGTIVEYTLPLVPGGIRHHEHFKRFPLFHFGRFQPDRRHRRRYGRSAALRRAWRTAGSGQLGRIDLVPRIGKQRARGRPI